MTGRRDLWGGRFSEKPAQVLSRWNDSFEFDRELLPEEIEASAAWAAALARAGALRPGEAARLRRALAAIGGGGTPRGRHEDVHSYVEAELFRRAGPVAGKIHTGRSRNDQVATDLRLYLKKALAEARRGVLAVASALSERAFRESAAPMPGFTHARAAEPVTFGHWCLAYVEMLLRDAERLRQARERADECPLGCGALSGTPLPVDRARLARALGFSRPCANSLDAVSDRDAAADYLYAGAMLLSHLSRLAEDLIRFGSEELGFVDLPDRLATGSSRMPHKKNPDLLELLRGHAGRAVGELTGLLALLKGLPLAYDKDLQLDKEPVFRMRRTLRAALPAAEAVIASLRLDRRRMREAAGDERLLATELADALAARGVPFRTAHELVGRRFAQARASGRKMAELPPSREIRREDLRSLDVDRALSRRRAEGGTAPRRVARAAGAARKRIEKERRR